MLRRSLGQAGRSTRPASTMRSTSRVTPPVVSATSVLSLLMVSAAIGGAADVDQHVEEDQGDADGLLELPAEEVGEPAVGADDEAHELEALVVDLAQDATGCLSPGTAEGVSTLSWSPPWLVAVVPIVALPITCSVSPEICRQRSAYV